MIRWGDIWVADLNPRQGTESGKVRPVLIIQNQDLLDIAHPSVIVLPLTTNLIDDAYPLRWRVSAQEKLSQDSDIMMDQVRSIDRQRLTQGPLAHLNESSMRTILKALCQLVNVSHA